MDFEIAALAQAVNVPTKGGAETGLVEQRRMQQVRSGANFLDELLDKFAGLFGQLRGLGRMAADDFEQAADVHGEHGESLSGAVMQFASDVAAFVVLGGQQAPGEFAEAFGLLNDFEVAFFEFESFGEITVVFLGAFAFGDVAGNFGNANDAAGGVLNGRNGRGDLEKGAVFSFPNSFEMIDTLAAPETSQDIAFFVDTIGGNNEGNILADGFPRCVSEHALGTFVPGGDDAV
jgi:hypothetical protein